MKIHSAPLEKGKGPVVVLVALAIFCDMLVYGMVVPVLPLQVRTLGLGPEAAGLLFSSYALALLVATPVFGWLSDRCGRKGPMAAGLLGLAAATLLYAAGDSFGLLVAARTLQGLSAAATWTAGLALVAGSCAPEQRGTALGLALSGQAAGVLLGPTFGGWLFELGGWGLPTLVASGLALGLGIALLTVLKEPGRPAAPVRSPGTVALLGNPRILAVGVLVVAGALASSLLEPTLPVHLSAAFGFGPGAIGLLFGVPTLAYALSAPAAGLLPGRWGRRGAVVFGLALGSLGLVGLAAAPDGVWVTGALALFGSGLGLILAPTLPVLADEVDRQSPGRYGLVYSLYNMLYSLGMMAGPLAGGLLVGRLGLTWGYAAAAAGLAVLALGLVWGPRPEGSGQAVPEPSWPENRG